jgi:hypothetical protein
MDKAFSTPNAINLVIPNGYNAIVDTDRHSINGNGASVWAIRVVVNIATIFSNGHTATVLNIATAHTSWAVHKTTHLKAYIKAVGIGIISFH